MLKAKLSDTPACCRTCRCAPSWTCCCVAAAHLLPAATSPSGSVPALAAMCMTGLLCLDSAAQPHINHLHSPVLNASWLSCHARASGEPLSSQLNGAHMLRQ